MYLTIEYIILSLNVFIMILQVIGIQILTTLYRNGRDTVRILFLLNLSALELCKNVISILSLPIIGMFKLNQSVSHVINHFQDGLGVIGDGLNVLHYLVISYISIDRFLEICLGIKYPIYLNLRKAKYITIGTWLVLGIIFTSVLVTEEIKETALLYPGIVYLYACLDVFFICLFAWVHCYIFIKFVRAREVPVVATVTRTKKRSLIHIFRNSTFFIPTLTLVNFLLLRVFPDLVYIYWNVIPGKEDRSSLLAVLLLVTFSDLLDACVYIFTARVVRDLIYKRYHQMIRYCNTTMFLYSSLVSCHRYPIRTKPRCCEGISALLVQSYSICTFQETNIFSTNLLKLKNKDLVNSVGV